MRTYVITGTRVTVTAGCPADAPADTLVIGSPEELEASPLNARQLLALWNALPGAELLNRFKNRPTAVARLWAALEALPGEASAEPDESRAPRSSRPDSKQAQVIALLRRPGGATLDELAAATGWQRHTVRGAIAGALKKKLGLTIISAKAADGGAHTYRIVDAAPAAAAVEA